MGQKKLRLFDWQKEYKQKLVSMEEAAQAIKSGEFPELRLFRVGRGMPSTVRRVRDVLCVHRNSDPTECCFCCGIDSRERMRIRFHG